MIPTDRSKVFSLASRILNDFYQQPKGIPLQPFLNI
jgi:hypothetical protein